jgi:tetratricopeptide (TPR) repeat protein
MAILSIANPAAIRNTRHLSFPGTPVTEEVRTEALRLALQAAYLDPLDSRSQLCLGWSSAMNGLYDKAELAFELSHKTNDNDPWSIVSSAVGLAFCGHKDESRDLAAKALAIDLSPSKTHWSYQAVVFFLNEEYEQCIEACLQGGDVFADTPAWHAAALVQMGEIAAAEAKLRDFTDRLRKNWFGQEGFGDEAVATWLAECYPFKYPRPWQRLRDGLKQSGLATTLW